MLLSMFFNYMIHTLVECSYDSHQDSAFIVGSTKVAFLMCTSEIPQNLQNKFLLLTFCYLYFRASFSNYDTFSTYRKSFCTLICQVSLLTSSCQFSMNPPCSLLPCASLRFFRYLFIMLPQGSLWFLSVPH